MKDQQMQDLLDNKTSQELAQTLVVEIAKAQNELRCAEKDIKKATNRMNFLVVVANKLINRSKD